MNQPEIRTVAVGIAFVLLMSSGCSSASLSRAKATELIKSHSRFHDPNPFLLYVILWNSGLSLDGRQGETYKVLERTGYIAIDAALGKTELTEKGTNAALATKDQIIDCAAYARCVFLPVATATFREVTGIVNRGIQATVEFKWTHELTPLGRELADAGLDFAMLPPPQIPYPFDPAKPDQASASFTLYDDGWRLQDVQW